MDTQIVELKTEDEWIDAFPVMMQLWADTSTEFSRESYVELLRELRDVEGYRLFGLYGNEVLVAVAGVSIRMSAWYGRYLWVYDLVTDSDYRSKGYGEQLLSFLKQWAIDHDCETIALASALERRDTHRFYEDLNMKKSSYVFKQTLN